MLKSKRTDHKTLAANFIHPISSLKLISLTNRVALKTSVNFIQTRKWIIKFLVLCATLTHAFHLSFSSSRKKNVLFILITVKYYSDIYLRVYVCHHHHMMIITTDDFTLRAPKYFYAMKINSVNACNYATVFHTTRFANYTRVLKNYHACGIAMLSVFRYLQEKVYLFF